MFIGSDKTRKPKSSKDQILEKLRESLMPEQIESGDVEDLSKKVDNPDAVVELIKKIQKIIKNKKNNISTLAYHQGVIFRKFKTNDRFISSVSECKISKTTINFKIDIVKFIDDYPQMRTSCISLFFFFLGFL